MRFIWSNRASISVVLAVLMLPMLTFGGLMVDVVRISLSHRIIAGAADLGMNAALANYDSVLKKKYGLYALSQVGPDSLETLNGIVADHMYASLEASRPLKIGSREITAEFVGEYNLANPKVLAGGIVEFMKYRGLVGIGSSLYNTIPQLGKMSSKTRVIDRKVQMEREVNGISKLCAELYSAIVSYDRAVLDLRDGEDKSDFPHLLLDHAISLGEQIKQAVPGIERANTGLDTAMELYLEDNDGEEDDFYTMMRSEHKVSSELVGKLDVEELLVQLRDAKELIEEEADAGGVYLKRIGEITRSGDQIVGVPPFYVYLASSFGGAGDGFAEPDRASVNNLIEGIRKLNASAKEKASVDDGTDYLTDVFEGVPSGGNFSNLDHFDEIDAGDLFGIAKQLTSVSNSFTAFDFQEAGQNFWENLLLTEYVMGCFSSHTSSGDEVSYTGMPIDPENNRIFGCEAEYVIYGNKGCDEKKVWFLTVKRAAGPETNIAAAKRSIFAVRFSANCIYALSNTTIDAMTLTPAMTIQAASGGTIPFTAAQLLLKLALALAESSIDLHELTSDKKVPLMKTDSTWRCSVGGLIRLVSEALVEKVEDLVREGVQDGVGMIQGCIDGVVDLMDYEVGEVVDGLLDDAETLIESKLISTLDLVRTVIESESELALIKILQTGTFDRQAFIDTTMGKLRGISQLPPFTSLIEDEIAPLLDTAAEDIFGSDDIIDFGDIYGAVTGRIAKAMGQYSDLAKGTLKEKAGEATGFIGDKLKEIVKKEGNTLAKGLAKEMSEETKACLEYIFSGIPQWSGPIGKSESDPVLLSLAYNDYLRLLLFLGLNSSGREDVILRIADLIQMNVSLHHSRGTGFRISASYTRLEIYADVYVPALLIPYNYRIYSGDKKYRAGSGF